MRMDRARLRVLLAVPRPGRPARRRPGVPRRRTRQVGRHVAGQRPGRRGRLRGLLLDVTPLRLDRDYRWLWAGQVVSAMGNQVTRVALPFQVWLLTGSTLAVGLIAAVQLLPILVFSMGGGAIADAVDRRRLMLITTFGQAASSLALVGLALTPSTSILAVYAVAFIATALSAIEQPARGSAIPRLVPARRLPSAIALGQLNFQIASVVGPAVGGVIIANAGLPAAYAVDAVSFAAAVVAVLAIAPMPPLGTVARPGLGAIREGLRFAMSRRVILATFAIDLDAMIFGMPTSLFPALSVVTFHGGATEFGLLVAAPAAGALLGALLSGWVSAVRRTGRATILAVLGWGFAITAFGLATFSLPLALVFLAIAGASDVLSAVFRSTIVQLETPDELRGRISALHMLVVTSGPRMGDLEAAAVASIIGAQASVISGGIVCILGVAVVARLFPDLAKHISRVGGSPVPEEASRASA